MAEFRTIRMSFWEDPFIEDLLPSEKLLYIYLFTNPHTDSIGFMEISRKRIAFETGIDAPEVSNALAKFEAAGKIVTDGTYIWLTKFVKHQSTTSPKMLDGMNTVLKGIPSQKIRNEIAKRYSCLLCIPEGYVKPIDTVANDTDTVSNGINTVNKDAETINKDADTVSEGYPNGMDTLSEGYAEGMDTVSEGYPNGMDTVRGIGIGIGKGIGREGESRASARPPAHENASQYADTLAGKEKPTETKRTPEAKQAKDDGKKKTVPEKGSNIPPTLEEVRQYCQEKNNGVNADEFWSHYQAVGWMCGPNRMKNWIYGLANWKRQEQRFGGPVKTVPAPTPQAPRQQPMSFQAIRTQEIKNEMDEIFKGAV